jgi:hypothetical protein
MVATDLMAFAGVDAEQAADVAREATGEIDVPTPPTPGTPFQVIRRKPPR